MVVVCTKATLDAVYLFVGPFKFSHNSGAADQCERAFGNFDPCMRTQVYPPDTTI